MDFVFDSNEKRLSDIELEETFVPEEGGKEKPSQMTLVQRIKHEVKSGQQTQHEAIRVNFITRMLDSIDEANAEMTLGEEIAYNTLFYYGMLKEI